MAESTKMRSFRSSKSPTGVVTPSFLKQLATTGKFGTLEIVADEMTKAQGEYFIATRCRVCGKEDDKRVHNLLSGNTKNCQCKTRRKYTVPEGKNVKRLASRYHNILKRCNNENDPKYKNYGGRGIKCMFENQEHFIRYILQNLPHESYVGLHIDRINNNGHYEPGNIILSTPAENIRKSRRARYVEYNSMMVQASHLWHLLRHDYPRFGYALDTTNRLATKKRWQDILEHGLEFGRGRPSPGDPDSEILTLYNRGGVSNAADGSRVTSFVDDGEPVQIKVRNVHR